MILGADGVGGGYPCCSRWICESEKDILGSPFPRDRFDGGYSLSRLGVRARRDVVVVDEVVGGSGGSGGKEGNGVIGVLVVCLLGG